MIRRGHRSEHLALVAQHVDIGDRLPAVGDQHGEIDQYPASAASWVAIRLHELPSLV